MSDLVETKAETWKDYDAIEQAVMESERGRWFLDEYGKRLRGSETAKLLAAMRKLEQAVSHSQDLVAERLGRALGMIEAVDHRLSGAASGDGALTQRHLKFFNQDEEIFEADGDAAAAPVKTPIAVVAGPPAEALEEAPESAPLDQPAATAAPDVQPAPASEAKPKRRIVIIRHEPGEDIPVPLEHEASASA